MTILAKNLKYLRNNRGLQQQEIADMFNLKTYTTVSKWENGVSEPSIYIIKEIARLYGYSVNQLIDIDLQEESVMPDSQKGLVYTQKEINEIFGSRLEQKRNEMNLSQSDLASLTGLTKSVIKQFEKGQREPKRDLVFKLAGILNVDMDYFTLQTGKKPSEDIAVSKGVVFDLTKEITEVSQALIFLEMKQLFFISKRGIMKLPLGEVLKFANEVRVSLLEIKKM